MNPEETYPQANSQHYQEVTDEHHYVQGGQWRWGSALLWGGDAGALGGLHPGQSQMLTQTVGAATVSPPALS